MVDGPFFHSSMPSVQPVSGPEVHTKLSPRKHTSNYSNILGDDSFSERLLRPWSFASHDDGDLPTSARVSAVDETWSISEETYTQPRRRRKSFGAWAKYSSSSPEIPSSEEQFAVSESGWWKQQMLVDRSLRSMAALTTVFATIMVIVCCTYMSDFVYRWNPNSTSVGSKKPKSCRSTENTNVVRHVPVDTRYFVLSCLTCLF